MMVTRAVPLAPDRNRKQGANLADELSTEVLTALLF